MLGCRREIVRRFPYQFLCLPVDRHRDAGQATTPSCPTAPQAATLYATQNVNTLGTAAYD